jgi:hypothetical protein
MRLFWLVVLLALFSCTSKPQSGEENLPAGNLPPGGAQQDSAVISIRPVEATRDTLFFSLTANRDLSGSKVEWMINGQPVQGQAGLQFKPAELAKGDVVLAKVITGDKMVLSTPVKIKNSPPAVSSAAIVPSAPRTFDTLTVNATGVDRDGDKVTYKYEWFRNDQPAGDQATLVGPFKAGDRIMLKLAPFDGEEYGPTMVLIAPINNSPPVVIRKEKSRYQGSLYSYRIEASDPDGDALTFKLRKGPSGMTIEEATGLITWRVAAKDAGKHQVSVQISDSHGGDVLYDFEVAIGVEK